MLKLRQKSKGGFETSPMVVAVLVAVSIIAATGIILTILPILNRSKDTRVMEDIKTLSNAIGLYITDTNGEAPCFDPTLKEGAATADVAASELCKQNGKPYNYRQGGTTTANTDLDKDGVMGEFMTPHSILGVKYIAQIPAPAYNGEPYYYTKGLNTTTNFTQAYAVSGLLHSDKADSTVTEKVSILDTISGSSDAVAFTDSTTNTSCRAEDIMGSGLMAGHASGVNGASTAQAELGGWKYYGVPSLNATTFKAANAACDIYSEGFLYQNAFGGTAGASPTITINAR